mgnify:CR=1 FL=1
MKYSRDAQLDLGKIQNGEKYANQLSGTIVSQPIIDQINMPSTYLTVLMQKSNFERWPQGLKWGLEALVVVSVIVVLLTVAPWQKVLQIGIGSGSKEVVLAEVDKPQTAAPVVVEDNPQFVDEEPKTAKPLQTPVAAVASPAPTTAAAKASPKVVPTPIPTVVVTPVAKHEEEKPAADGTPAAGGGFLYRGELEVTNLSVVGPKITEKIKELGGRKAGGVELGWQKSPTSTYYHFTLPEAKYQELSNFMGTYGKTHLNKEKHPRVMPDGIIRLIITVDEAKK